MTMINDAFMNAILADATYALGNAEYKNYTGTQLADLLLLRMTPELAQYIGDNFTIIHHIEKSDTYESGFDATVWQHNTTGKIYVSMQGTSGFGDFLTDIDLSIGNGAPASQIVDMVNWWMRITTPVGQMAPQIAMANTALILPIPDIFYLTNPVPGEGLVANNASVTVNGHSLGGGLIPTTKSGQSINA